MALLFSNTFDEAIAWLTESTGEVWTVRRVLEEILAHDELVLEVVPPRNAQFGIYRYDPHCPPEMGYLPSGPFVFIGPAEPRPRFPLRDKYIIELLEYGEAELVYAQIPADDDPNGRWVIPRPYGTPLRVTLDMCRVSILVAHRLAAYSNTARTPVSGSAADEQPVNTESPGAPVTDSSNTPPALADWCVKARQLADDIGLMMWNRGERRISARSVSPKVAEELAKDKAFWGNQGPRSESNIRNEALKGWTFTPPPDTPMEVA
ncbi:hypothetical protein [Burkholderia stagnalis]|uniref:hypothetical protein n=1 Tax=Burkholderia stagnalis TaxID=1503054 RepID=UPI000F5BEC7E|nr:hypothetical protein [Burkholderia stagnalis]